MLGKANNWGAAGSGLDLCAACCAIVLLVACAPTVEAASEPASPAAAALSEVAVEPALVPDAKPTGRPPTVPLDRLFELPAGFETKPRERRAGGDEPEWRKRFHDARGSLERANVDLKRSKSELANLAEESNAWTLAPPIGGGAAAATEAPLSYELRQRMKRQQVAVADAKQVLLNLEVEANLAGVPEEWRTEGQAD